MSPTKPATSECRFSTRISIRWLPDPPSETTDTIVMSVKDWYLDLRMEKETGMIDWAIAGQRIVESQDPLRVSFSHELDSHDAFESVDCGTFVSLPNGDDLETGVMPRSDLPGAPECEYEEVWRELPFREGPEGGNGNGGISWVLESDNGDISGSDREGEVQVVKTFLGRIWGTYLALRQTQIHARMRDPSGALVVKKSGAGVSARREEWESGWKEKYVVGEVAGALPSMVDGFAGEGRWKRPDLCAPVLNVTHYEEGNVTQGYIFLSPYHLTNYKDGPYIYSHTGELVWNGAEDNDFAHNFHPCHIAGHDRLYRDLHTTEGKRDSTEIQAGRDCDIHELKIVENGTAVLTTWIMTRPWDLSSYGGPASGFLRTTGFQEVDIASQTVLFTWDPADHIDLKDSNMEFGWDHYGDGLTPQTDWDFFHINSVDKTQDGGYLISGRHTSTIYKISPRDGSVLWRLGGNNSDFTFEPGLNFSSQHHVRVRDEDEGGMTISLFNNAFDKHHQTAHSSSGLVLRIDMDAMHVTLVHRYSSPRGLLVEKEGSVQPLESGNVFISWGAEQSLTEHILDGSRVVFEAKLDDSTGYWYRAWKANFTTVPTTSPDVYAMSEGIEGPTVWFVSWNGATEVQGWKVYVSRQQWGRYEFIGHFEKHGFETRIESEKFFAWTIIEAVDGAGQALRNSSVPVRTSTRRRNLLGGQTDL
ncbi:hypothetical protein N7460_006421 [Penicillium canescens]|uniref:ASST-domain-containing protein n=1 Tax=Penicillium canescens TaxID=5083 RepID=A0AAD6IG74_PENCN|nr:hypothetical protein N7460_006421 [Penicillium canescens]KAJ6056536.1 hypothetical protein N7444_005634 [Penicillium canescens]